MKILVTLKRVADPDNADKIRVTEDSRSIDCGGLEWKLNPFDHYALEAALRLTEDGRTPKARLGEVVVVTLGPAEVEPRLRGALAAGAGRAIRVEANDDELDGRLVALALRQLVEEEQPDLVLMGKLAVDGENDQVAQYLAELLDWPQATFVATLREEAAGTLLAEREIDGGVQTVRLGLPAVISVDLRIVAPRSVTSRSTPSTHEYVEGVRFASLLAMRQAQSKPLSVRGLRELVPTSALACRYESFALAPRRGAGQRVASVAELVDLLASEAKVIR